jgi:hypothetical protein
MSAYTNVRRALPTFSTEGWINHGNFFSVEASQMPGFRVGRVWDDACDEGCFFQSHKSGKKVVFTLVKRDENEGDVAGWHLESFGIPQKLKVLVVNT